MFDNAQTAYRMATEHDRSTKHPPMTAPALLDDANSRSAPSASHRQAGSGGSLISAAEARALPTSFGVFKPVGNVKVGVPPQAQVDALVVALQDAGWPGSAVRQFSPLEGPKRLSIAPASELWSRQELASCADVWVAAPTGAARCAQDECPVIHRKQGHEDVSLAEAS